MAQVDPNVSFAERVVQFDLMEAIAKKCTWQSTSGNHDFLLNFVTPDLNSTLLIQTSQP